MLGPNTERWQDAINEMVTNARCFARQSTKLRSSQQWASLADEVQNRPSDILWTEIMGGASTCPEKAARQRQQVENLAALMRIYDSPGKVILVDHSVLTYEMSLQESSYHFRKSGMTRSVAQYTSRRTVLDFAISALSTLRMEGHLMPRPFFSPTCSFQRIYASVVVDNPGNNTFPFLQPRPRHDVT